ncbi:putative peptidoglycan lipid II flippase [Alteribacillus persepolensis]|uniref:Probable lipid II flippase MurJ n=1 Tax=Alteribacillus persepolensis TaxID=568899 RepID=A0A1G8ADM9_9BACI|nr:murein biosynthesis integral membrane protein MurJ [Alteribacillus persepolensis]SDH18936.1 putative peptidoglycan lipid II flippase [Alteribacillus persepolensis]
MKGKKLLQIIGAVAVINMLSRLIGFFREVVIGYQFGTSYAADSVVTAYTLPNFFYVVIGGAVTTAFISVYTKIDDPLGQHRYLERMFGWLSLAFLFFSALLVFFSEQVIALLFSGMEQAEFQLTADLFRVMAPATFFLILSMWLTGILNVNNRFSWAAVATLVLNGSFLGIAVVFYPWLGAYAHAWGALFSAFFMCMFLVYFVRKGKFFSFRPRLEKSRETWRTLKIGMPILLGGATLQLYFLLHRMFASWLEDGYIAALNYTSKVVQMPQSVLMMAVTTVIYPLLSRKVAAKEESGIQSLYGKGLRMMGLVILPATVFVLFYAEDIIRIIFQYGNFTEQSTAMAAPLLQILVIGMFFHSANLFITRFFYAYERSIFPVVISLVSVLGINVVIAFLLIESYGAAGVAWGTSIASICNFILLLAGTRFVLKWQGTMKHKAGKEIGKLLLLLLLFAAALFGFNFFMTAGGSFVRLVSGGFTAVFVLIVLMKLLRFQEVDEWIQKVKKKVVKK